VEVKPRSILNPNHDLTNFSQTYDMKPVGVKSPVNSRLDTLSTRQTVVPPPPTNKPKRVPPPPPPHRPKRPRPPPPRPIKIDTKTPPFRPPSSPEERMSLKKRGEQARSEALVSSNVSKKSADRKRLAHIGREILDAARKAKGITGKPTISPRPPPPKPSLASIAMQLSAERSKPPPATRVDNTPQATSIDKPSNEELEKDDMDDEIGDGWDFDDF